VNAKTYKAVQVVAAFAWAFGMIAIVLVAALCCSGCAYKGAKVTEGTDLAVGLNVPMTEGTLQLQVLNYLSGFRVGVDRNAIMTIKYAVAETNDYFGCVHTRVYKRADVTVEPCETSSADSGKDIPEQENPDGGETR